MGLGRQVASRASNGTRMRISAAHLPQVKTLEGFTFSHVSSATRDVIAHLPTTTFVARRDNVVLPGPPGTGKTHVAIALAIKAAEATCPVSFDSATGWITRLADAHARGRLAAELKRLSRYPSWSSTKSATCRSTPRQHHCSSSSSPPDTRPDRSS